jgi:hypothetical protein
MECYEKILELAEQIEEIDERIIHDKIENLRLSYCIFITNYNEHNPILNCLNARKLPLNYGRLKIEDNSENLRSREASIPIMTLLVECC